MTPLKRRLMSAGAVLTSGVVLAGCSFSPYDLPLPGGADIGSDPYEITVEFRDVLDLVPQSAVHVDDLAVGKVTAIELNGWTATATLQINDAVQLPANAEANLRQSNLLGEKFVSLETPANPSSQMLEAGDAIPLERSGRNPDIEEVLGAASLLLNGGGLEKTNTIVRELNRALDGNEPEVRQLLRTSEQFIGQLDDNKEELLVALDKVNNLARTAQDQEGAIIAALDDLPEALAVLDEQRDQIVGLLQALDRLGDVAVDVIRESKDDTLAVLRDLEPTLGALADSGDDLATSSQVLLSFPFSDAIVGDSFARASEPCPETVTSANRRIVEDTACYGDYINLDINLELDALQVGNLLSGLLSLLQNTILPARPTTQDVPEEAPREQSPRLVPLAEGLSASGGEPSGSDAESSPDAGAGGFCGLLGLCRSTVSSPEAFMESTHDLGRLVVGPAVAR